MAGRFFRSVEDNRETPEPDKVPQIEDMLKEPVTNGSVPEPRIRPAKARSSPSARHRRTTPSTEPESRRSEMSP